jgi:hypothetical protein
MNTARLPSLSDVFGDNLVGLLDAQGTPPAEDIKVGAFSIQQQVEVFQICEPGLGAGGIIYDQRVVDSPASGVSAETRSV